MSEDDIGYAIYLGAILIFVGSSLIISGRDRVPMMLKQAASWVLIFCVVIAGFSLYNEWQGNQVAEDGRPKLIQLNASGDVEIPVSFDGHYYVTLLMNGTPVDFVVDTGATEIVLTMEDAAKIGIRPESLRFNGQAMSANGVVRTAVARIADVQMGPFRDRNVRVAINEGEMPGSLLGMSYLSRFDKVSIEGRKMVISRN